LFIVLLPWYEPRPKAASYTCTSPTRGSHVRMLSLRQTRLDWTCKRQRLRPCVWSEQTLAIADQCWRRCRTESALISHQQHRVGASSSRWSRFRLQTTRFLGSPQLLSSAGRFQADRLHCTVLVSPCPIATSFLSSARLILAVPTIKLRLDCQTELRMPRLLAGGAGDVSLRGAFVGRRHARCCWKHCGLPATK
jgi:hypothetical protein